MRSNKPAAKKFRKWVTSEVLPAIRRNGYYIHPELVDRKEERRIRKQLAAGVLKYLTDENLRNVAKKFGVSRYAVKYAVEGTKSDNAIMQECQRLALLNKEKELNAYHPKRMLEVINKLNR